MSATAMPEPRAVEVNGVTLDVVDIGEGEPIVFLHGAIADLRVWADYVEPVSAGHRFIAYTRRHHGERPWPENPVFFSGQTATPVTCDYAAAIEAPTLVLLGVETHRGWSMEAERLVDCLPDATLTLVPGVNHRGPVAAPKTIARSILEFVDANR